MKFKSKQGKLEHLKKVHGIQRNHNVMDKDLRQTEEVKDQTKSIKQIEISGNKVTCENCTKSRSDENFLCEICGNDSRFNEETKRPENFNDSIDPSSMMEISFSVKEEPNHNVIKSESEETKEEHTQLTPNDLVSNERANQNLTLQSNFEMPAKSHDTEISNKLDRISGEAEFSIEPIKKLQCDKCRKSFKQRTYLNRHILLHENTGKKYSCDSCPKTFNLQGNLKQHHQLIHAKIRFPCPQCSKPLTSKRNLKNHLKICTSNLDFDKTRERFVQETQLASPNDLVSSETLGKTLSLQNSFKIPSDSKNEAPSKSEILNKLYQISNEAETYKPSETFDTAEIDLTKKHKCDKCSKIFKNGTYLKTHFRIVHDKIRYSCPKCPKVYCSNFKLKDHIACAHEDRGYSCDNCPKVFNSQAHLKQHHLLIHEKVRFPCPLCSKALTSKWILKKHLKICTSNSSNEVIKDCKICAQPLINPNGKKHKIRRCERIFKAKFSGKKYQCDSCMKSFNLKRQSKAT